MASETPKRQKPLSRVQRTDYDGSLRFAGNPSRENRAMQIKRSDDKIGNISIGLQDIDEAILYYFQNVIQPRVLDNGILIDVPIRYGDPESWSAIQRDGFMRDDKNHIIAPVIMYRRTNMSRDDNVPIDKADGNLVHTFPKKKSNAHNSYDRFSLIHNLKPTYEMYNVVVPDYVVITYECMVWTSFIVQMNRILEKLQYSEGQYWGDEKRFKFKSAIESFDNNTEINTERGRLVRNSFTLTIKGFLVPEVANDLITTQKNYTTQQIIIDAETEVDVFSITQTDPLAQKITVTSNRQPVTGNQSIMDLINEKFNELNGAIIYLRKQKVYS